MGFELFKLMLCSGLFGKSKDLDILPPPPPFPGIEEAAQEVNDNKKTRKRSKRAKKEETDHFEHLFLNKDEPIEDMPTRKKEGSLLSHSKEHSFSLFHKHEDAKETRKKPIVKSKKTTKTKKLLTEKTKSFLHGVGLYRTPEERKELRLHHEEYTKRREAAAEMLERELKKSHAKKQDKKRTKKAHKVIRRHARLYPEASIHEPFHKLQIDSEFSSFDFGAYGIDDLDEIEEGRSTPLISKHKKKMFSFSPLSTKKTKKHDKKHKLLSHAAEHELEEVDLELKGDMRDLEPLGDELKEVEAAMPKPKEVIRAEKEIQKAIDKIKKKPRTSFLKTLFAKKEKEMLPAVEQPHVMPRFTEKLDPLLIVEGNIHKARMALMDFKFDESKQIYVKIMRLYNSLSPDLKARVYDDINDLYQERKNAEKYAG